ncbi:two-component system, sporulation sensor kinase B [Paenibacillus sophorae]|uniref:histidine kinase n=1 Tax=Paenibacillus sophorae TaxID=1333845 RepID=A0A1H8TFX5_9BACL|nr:ATP-binding protein [Paenibacillus sophorae]QWU16178.1 two-component sensor histidine kinase [Paenibacillus sophorae]SEO89705.1 two-component system, sporulation sensor kinase B [Paenibacillus sophorae]
MFETLLLNFLFLLFPVVIVLIFFENRTHSYNRKMLILLSAVTMILCIAKPIKLEMGFIFDLRYIPFIIVALFGGYKNVLPLYLILNICRFYVGGGGTIPSFLYSTAVFILIPLFSKKFLKLDSKSRILCATVISFLTMGFYLIILSMILGTLDRQFWTLTFHALTTHVVVMGIIMLLIEKIITNIKNRDRILQSERLNVVSELAASVSHEIRNPLTVTSGFLQLLNKSNTITPVEKGYIELSLQELNRAEKIVSDYLSFAKPQSENMVYSNMKAESEYTKNLILPYATIHQVEVQFSFNNSLNKSYDRNQIQQCLINLYKNGIEAMKDKGGGTLIIDISERKQNIIISIQDTGIGMTKEEISRLGKPYYSTKEEGTGLGMLMAYSTINKVKGIIEVDSEKGKGTTFVITIPT